VFLVVFVVFFGQYVNVLPRYFLQSWPALLVGLGALALECGLRPRAIGTAFALFALFGLANAHGRFHPTRLAEWSDPADPRPLVRLDAAPSERRVWAVTPNVFCGPLSRILPGDEVLETIERGRLRAFIVRRPALH